MRILFFVCDGVLHPSRNGVPPHYRGATASNILSAGYFRWSPHLAETLEGYDDVVLINECEWGARLKQRTLLQCLGPAARWFAGALDSRPDSIESARALFLKLACPSDWMRMLPAPQPRDWKHVFLVDPLCGISSAATKRAFQLKWQPGTTD